VFYAGNWAEDKAPARDKRRAKQRACQEETRALARIAHDVFGNSFRPAALDPTWLAPSVISLAQAACDKRLLPSGHLKPARLATLADALEEAGCSDPDVLGHLRSPGPHVRGCWPLDRLLKKA
jgi:hypothetical protein